MAATVGHTGFRIKVCHGNQPNKTELVLYKLLFSPYKLFKTVVHISNKIKSLNYKSGCGIYVCAFKRRANLGNSHKLSINWIKKQPAFLPVKIL